MITTTNETKENIQTVLDKTKRDVKLKKKLTSLPYSDAKWAKIWLQTCWKWSRIAEKQSYLKYINTKQHKEEMLNNDQEIQNDKKKNVRNYH